MIDHVQPTNNTRPILTPHSTQNGHAVVMSATEETAILSRMNQLETMIANGFADMNSKFNAALLEQERRNSSFATRDRLDDLGRKLDGVATEAMGRNARVTAIEANLASVTAQLVLIDKARSAGDVDRLKAMLGFLASGLGVMLTGIITWILAHGGHP